MLEPGELWVFPLVEELPEVQVDVFQEARVWRAMG